MQNDDPTIDNRDTTRTRGDNSTVLGNEAATAAATRTAGGAASENHAGNGNEPPATDVPVEKGNLLLGLYRVESDPIVGGMGRVFRVHHTGWNTDLAMKQPKKELFRNEAQKQAFIHECDAWINLGLHPHIVSCYYVREIGGIPSIFAEWMDGGSLKNFIESEALYHGDEKEILERILDISIQFARGLHYAHEQQLIHQDVKPDNLLLSKTGEAKVADFGIANARMKLKTADGSTSSPAGTIVSGSGAYTPAYCSPEQAKGEKLTRRTDIWSWAASALEMFLGERLWNDGWVAGMACEDYFGTEKIPLPEAMKELLRHCFRENEAERPHDFKEVEKSLLAIYNEETGAAYSRIEPKAAADTADSLNNKALSYLDLGKPEKAEKCWEQALKIDPYNALSLYNKAAYLWNNAKIDDLDAIQLIFSGYSEQTDYYLSYIFVAQGDLEKAENSLRRYIDKFGKTADAQTLLQAIKNNKNKQSKIIRKILSIEDCIEYTYLSQDGKTAIVEFGMNCSCVYDLEKGLKITELPFQGIGYCAERKIGFYYKTNKGVTIQTNNDENSGQIIFGTASMGINMVSCSPDGNTALFVSQNRVYVWDIIKNCCKFEFQIEEYSFLVSYSPDGNMVLFKDKGDSLSVWDLSRQEKIAVIESRKTFHACFDPTGTKILLGQEEDFSDENLTLMLFDINTKEVRYFGGHKARSIVAVHIERNGLKAWSCDNKGIIKCWNLKTGRCIRSFESVIPNNEEADFTHCSMSDNRILLDFTLSSAITSLESAKLYSLEYALEEERFCDPIISKISGYKEIEAHVNKFTELEIKMGPLIENRNIDEALTLLKAMKEYKNYVPLEKWRNTVEKVAKFCVRDNISSYHIDPPLSSDNYHYEIYSGEWDYSKDITLPGGKKRIIWDKGIMAFFEVDKSENITKTTRRPKQEAPGLFARQLMVLMPDFKKIVTIDNYRNPTSLGYEGAVIEVWDINREKCIRSFIVKRTHVFSAYADSRSRFIVLGTIDGLAFIDSKKWKIHGPIGNKAVTDVIVSPDGKYLFSVNNHEDKIYVWDLPSGEKRETAVLSGKGFGLTHILMNRDGTRICAIEDGGGSLEYNLEFLLSFPGWADWDEGAQPYLEIFMALHPNWTDADFDNILIPDLQRRGYGWLRPEGVKARLKEMDKKPSFWKRLTGGGK